MLVYGHLPRGPLAVLRESWTGDINLPPRLGLQPKKYLQKMKENLEKHWCMLTNIPMKSSCSTTRKLNTKNIFQTDDAFTGVCQEKGMDCCANHNCVNQMHKHGLILYVFYVLEPFNLCCDSNDCAEEAVLSL